MMSSSDEEDDQNQYINSCTTKEQDKNQMLLDAFKQQNSETANLKEVSIDDEIKNLECIYASTQSQLKNDFNLLQSNIVNYKEPESINILDRKIDKEREYIQ